MKNKLLLATNGSQGVVALRELYALGYRDDSISIITFNSRFNGVFIEFLKFNKKRYTVIESLNHLDDYFKDKEFDILLSISFRFIFSETSLKRINIAAINFHPGILPEYKGSFSIPWAIINNEDKVGYTFHYMTVKVDSGEYLYQEKFLIDGKTSHALNYLIFQRGILMLGRVLKKAENKQAGMSRKGGRFYPNKLPFGGEINPKWGKDRIERFIRAMYFPPFEPAFLIVEGEKVFFDSYKKYNLFNKKLL